jgi:hypothetical protein
MKLRTTIASAAAGFILLVLTGVAHALDGNFDRSAEVAKYLDIVQTGSRLNMTRAAKELYVSGIDDPRLAAALSERLLRDTPSLVKNNRADGQYGAWMVKALASTGVEQYAATIEQVQSRVKVGAVRMECKEELEKIAWHKAKNRIMNSRENHVEGGNERASQLLNLIKADDFTFKQFAADRVSWEKQLDERILDEMAEQLIRYMNDTGRNASRAQGKALGLYAKLLGYSGLSKYRDPLDQVLASKASALLKKHAREAIKKMQ